jgi:hypothetical protein
MPGRNCPLSLVAIIVQMLGAVALMGWYVVEVIRWSL